MIRNLEINDYEKGMNTLLEERYGKQAIYKEEYIQRLERIKSKGSDYFIWIEDEKVIGCVKYILEEKFSPDKRYVGHIEDLYVLESYRRNDIGKQLVEVCFNFLKKKDCYKIVLECTEGLVKFYEKIGIVRNGISLEYRNL